MENPFAELRELLVGGRPEEAERRLLSVAPRGRAPRLMLARLANEHGFWWLAEKLSRELISWDGRDSEAWSALAFAAFSRGRHREARTAYEKALAISPHYDAARRNLASLLAEQELSEEALAQADELTRRVPATPALNRTRARALIQLDRFDEAEAILLSLVGAQPGDTASHELLVRLRQLRGDADPSREMRAAVERAPDDARLRMGWANVLRRLSDAAGAERELRGLSSALGPLPQLLGSLATVIQDQGRMDEAVALARQALAGGPTDVDIAETFVATAIATGAAAEALPVVDRMRAATPQDQRWITHRIDAARALGQAEFECWWDPARVTRHYDLPMESIDELRDEVLALHREGNHPLDQSLRQGTQTSRNLLVRPSARIKGLLALFTQTVERFRAEVIAELPVASGAGPHPLIRDAAPAELVGCWSVKLRRGGFHVNHIHPEGWLSSAFYLSVPAEVQDAAMRAGWLKFGEPRYPVAGLEPTGFVQPAPGRLVLFPSYLWHGTNPLTSSEPRVSVAFDALPASEIH
jgi:Flp pilus assembly protein TadD